MKYVTEALTEVTNQTTGAVSLGALRNKVLALATAAGEADPAQVTMDEIAAWWTTLACQKPAPLPVKRLGRHGDGRHGTHEGRRA